MNRILFKLTVMLLVIACCMTSCGKSQREKIMSRAELLMETHPDSALQILESLDEKLLGTNSELARYALVMSEILEKNDIDVTTFDVIRPAVRFYMKKGTPDEKFRTLYCKGLIYMNQRQYGSAMQSFLAAKSIKKELSDSLVYARLLVSQAILYKKLSKISEFVNCHLQAARIFGKYSKHKPEIESYAHALKGAVMLGNRSKTDSILTICRDLEHKHPEEKHCIQSSYIDYIVAYGNEEEIKGVLNEIKDTDISNDTKINMAYGCGKIGDFKAGLKLLENVALCDISDTINYLAVKTDLLSRMGEFQGALDCQLEYSRLTEKYNNYLLSNDLMFSEDKHGLIVRNTMAIHKKEKIITYAASGIVVLLVFVIVIYYDYCRSQSLQEIAENENERLRLLQDDLMKEKTNTELELKQKSLSEERLRLEQDALIGQQEELKLQKENAEIEADNLRMTIVELSEEKNRLVTLLNEQQELTPLLQKVIQKRLGMLNSLLAKEITSNKDYAIPYNKWIESIRKDKDEFMNSTRMAFTVSHPAFIDYLKAHDLKDDEINYLCLYAIGLRGKEVGEYMQLRRHYNVSSAIRKKLGIDNHETNIGPYIRRLLKEY